MYLSPQDYCPHVSACLGLESSEPYLMTDAQALKVKNSVLNKLPINSDLKHEIYLGARWVTIVNKTKRRHYVVTCDRVNCIG